MNERKLRALGRKALIVLLFTAAVLLLRETGYYAGLREKLQHGGERQETLAGTESTGSARPAGAVQPMAAVVNLGGSEHWGAVYDAERVTEIFRRFSADFAEALGSAELPEPLSEDRLYACLNSCGVYLRFYCSQPLELLSAWLGTEASREAAGRSAELMCLCADGGETLLCCRTAEGDCFCCKTAVSAERLCERTAEYSADATQYAFENKSLQGGDGCAVLCGGSRTVPAVNCAVPQLGTAEMNALLQSVGMNSYVTGSYTEADGTAVYIDEESTLRLSPAGSMNYRCPAFPAAEETRTLSEAVTLAWQTAENCMGASCGDGTLIFAGASCGENGRYTVCFDYAVNGIPVHFASGHGAEIVLRGDRVIQARMQLCSFTVGEEMTALLPDLQAFAIAAAGDASAALCYTAGGETMYCNWVRADG